MRKRELKKQKEQNKEEQGSLTFNEWKSLKCSVCGRRSDTLGSLKSHKELYHMDTTELNGKIAETQDGRKICPFVTCPREFSDMKVVIKHLKLHGKFKCQFCETCWDYAPDLSLHELSHSKQSDKRYIKCKRCKFECCFKFKYVTHHLETHLGLTDKIYSCSVCHSRHTKSTALKTHFNQNHKPVADSKPELRHNCEKCYAYFAQNCQLQHHFQTKHKVSKTWTCKITTCYATFKSENDLEGHQRLHGTFKCNFCDSIKYFAEDAAMHELDHAKNKNKTKYQCPRCEFKTTGPVSHSLYLNHFLKSHLSLSRKILQCSICQSYFVSKPSLKSHHYRTHGREGADAKNLEKCDECPAYFLETKQLLYHKATVHKANSLKLTCKLCDKVCATKATLQSHRLLIHGIKANQGEDFKFVCDIAGCDDRFDSEFDLKWHKIMGAKHSRRGLSLIRNMDMVTCDKCGKEFKGEIALKRHMGSTHINGRSGENRCDKCDKLFKTRAAFEMHMNFHKGPEHWQFMCSVCSKKCLSKATLQSHMRTHTKEKPFVCQICGEKYAHRHNLRNHVNSKHKDEGVQDLPKKVIKRFYVSRKGKKLKEGFCFTQEQDKAGK